MALRSARVGVALALALALLAVGCGSDESESSRPSAVRHVVVDTDMATDDILALLFLLQRDDVSVDAVTVAGTGEAHCLPGVQHARSLLARTGHGDVPVACGRPRPLVGDKAFPSEWRAAADAFYGLEDAPEVSGRTDERAVDLLARVLRNGDSTTVVALGPLTNLADALLADPLLVTHLDRIVVMGGAVDVPGNVGTRLPGDPPVVAEWNTYVDPHAANVVFGIGGDVVLVPLDATNLAPIDTAFLDRLERSARTPASTIALDLLGKVPFVVRGGNSFWDPLAAAILAEPSLATFEDRRVRVTEVDGPRWGAIEQASDGARIRVATSADADRFEDVFLTAIAGRTPAPAVQVAPDVLVTYTDADGCDAEAAEVSVPAGDLSLTVDARSTDGTAIVIGLLTDGRTMADVEAVTSVAASVSTQVAVPPWFEIAHAVAAPPTGAPTWVFDLAAGEYAVVCASLDGTHVTPLTALHVLAP